MPQSQSGNLTRGRGAPGRGDHSCRPDMIAGIDAQPRDVLLEVAKFNAGFAKNV